MALDAAAQGGADGHKVERRVALLPLRAQTEQMLSVLWTPDAGARREAFRSLARTLEDAATDPANSDISPEQLRCHLDGLLRLALRCPYQDVREDSQALLEALQARGVRLPLVVSGSMSAFIPDGILNFAEGVDDDAQRLLETSFCATGRASHAYQLMCLFPSFAKKYQKLYEMLMYGDGPLPYDWRVYVAIMGASESRCQSLVNQHEVGFYASGGNPEWLQGLAKAPSKLQRLNRLNVRLARQPWLVGRDDLEELVTGPDSWAVPELMQAVIILVTFHSLAGMAWGVGIRPEIDRDGGSVEAAAATAAVAVPGKGPIAVVATAATVSTAPSGSGDPAAAPPTPPLLGHAGGEDTLQKGSNAELIGKLRAMKVTDDDSTGVRGASKLASVPAVASLLDKHEEADDGRIGRRLSQTLPDEGNRYCDVGDVTRSLFEGSSQPPFRLHDFSWEDQAYAVVGRYCPGIERLLDDMFRETMSLTDFTLFMEKNVDTAPFRLAIWYWVLYEKGMVHDDYNYDNWSTLNPKVSNYARLVSCRPEDVTLQDYNNMGVDLFDREKVHINLLIMEARRQAELVYVAHAITRLTGE